MEHRKTAKLLPSSQLSLRACLNQLVSESQSKNYDLCPSRTPTNLMDTPGGAPHTYLVAPPRTPAPERIRCAVRWENSSFVQNSTCCYFFCFPVAIPRGSKQCNLHCCRRLRNCWADEADWLRDEEAFEKESNIHQEWHYCLVPHSGEQFDMYWEVRWFSAARTVYSPLWRKDSCRASFIS